MNETILIIGIAVAVIILGIVIFLFLKNNGRIQRKNVF